MKERILAIATLAMMGFGGYIGYSTNYVETATANEVTIPRFVDIPRTQGFNLDINLNNGLIECNGQEQGVSVKIERKDSIIYKTRVVTKEVIKNVERRNHFPLREIKQNLLELCNVKPNSHRIQH